MLQLKHSVIDVRRDGQSFQFKDRTGSYSLSNPGGFGTPNAALSDFKYGYMSVLEWGKTAETIVWEWAFDTDGSLSYLADTGDSADIDLGYGVSTTRLRLGIPITSDFRREATNVLNDLSGAPYEITSDDVGKYISLPGADYTKLMKITAAADNLITFEPQDPDVIPWTVGTNASRTVIVWEQSDAYLLNIQEAMVAVAKKLAANCNCDDRFKHVWSMLKQAEAALAIGDAACAHRIALSAKAYVI